MNKINIIKQDEEINNFFTQLPQPMLLAQPTYIISSMEELLWKRICEDEGLHEDAS